ncbi:outer membrane beta-barrel protein [Methylocapsa sp. D3K7]|uniref:outer membrane protein n=1 Tax=Methylocapsa sp. D3K7 TaxID=3041435 RepID=UPI00244EF3A8|nr:outer membrane beta-barrel protein [Methylocapsa sp. D3K7]WGJ14025.1 outer membrane beta-barrel protein [Methylocapsa sp. D3K7]
MLRRILLASAGAMALAGTAIAADLPPPPPPPPPPLWTGFYIGANIGGTWGNSNTINTATANLDPLNGLVLEALSNAASAGLATFNLAPQTVAFIGGGQIGYNYQFANSWVGGLEADIQGVSRNGNTSVFSNVNLPAAQSIIQTAVASKSLEYFGTVRGRIGFLATPTLLVYGTGGLAYGGAHASTLIGQDFTGSPFLPNLYTASGSVTNTRVGWTAGGGVEWLFLPNWSAKVEYLYYDLGSVTYGLSPLANFSTALGGTLFTLGAPVSRTHFSGNVVRVGVNYHFNWGAPPVVAKY